MESRFRKGQVDVRSRTLAAKGRMKLILLSRVEELETAVREATCRRRPTKYSVGK